MTDCIDPGAIPEEALAAYAIDPEGEDTVAQHIARCPACATEVAEMSTLVSRLNTQLARYGCPTSEEITEYVAGMLPSAERAAIEQHMQQCSRCASDVAETREFLAQEDPILSWKHAPSAVRRLIPALRGKGTPAFAAPAFGLRGEAKEMTEFSDEDNDVMISLRYIADVRGRETLMGSIISGKQPELTLDESIPVRLRSFAEEDDAPAPDLIAEAVAEGGNFELAPVPPGQYQIEADLPDCLVVVGPITVG
jgi:hypothetical protein